MNKASYTAADFLRDYNIPEGEATSRLDQIIQPFLPLMQENAGLHYLTMDAMAVQTGLLEGKRPEDIPLPFTPEHIKTGFEASIEQVRGEIRSSDATEEGRRQLAGRSAGPVQTLGELASPPLMDYVSRSTAIHKQ